jgi:hypothetical protein
MFKVAAACCDENRCVSFDGEGGVRAKQLRASDPAGPRARDSDGIRG